MEEDEGIDENTGNYPNTGKGSGSVTGTGLEKNSGLVGLSKISIGNNLKKKSTRYPAIKRLKTCTKISRLNNVISR